MKARAIIALDVPNAAEVEALLARLGPDADFVKVGQAVRPFNFQYCSFGCWS